MKDFIDAGELATAWGISKRQVQRMCKQGKIEGAELFGNMWIIPRNAERPKDNRITSGKWIGYHGYRTKKTNSDDGKGGE